MKSETTGEKSLLTSDQICVIIKACAEAKVSLMKFGDLYVEFGKTAEVQPLVPAFPTETVADIAATQIKVAKDALLQDEIRTREEQISQMWIEDPVRAEQLLLDGGMITDENEEPDEEA